MFSFLYPLRKLDFWVLGAVLILSFLSLSQLYLLEKFRALNFIFEKQLFFLFLGLLINLIISYFPWDLLKNRGLFIFTLYLIPILFLIATLFFAPTKRGVESWLSFGGIDIQFSEIAKITTLLALAKYFSSRKIQIFKLDTILISSVYVLIPAILIIKQPDLGSAIILILMWFGLIFLSGIRLKHFLIFLLILIFLAAVFWNFLSPYQKNRIIGFLSPQEDILGKNYNVLQSKIAIAVGGLFGQGSEHSFQSIRGFLPEAHTDFIFASFFETRGLLGALVLFICYAIILFRLITFSFRKNKLSVSHGPSNFAKIFCLGIAFLIFSHIFINIGMNLQLLPVTGIPLPFFSYGGSYFLSLMIALGIYQSFFIRSKE